MILTADYVSLLLAPILAEICAREAPRVVFEFVSATPRRIDDLAGIDFLIASRAFGHALGKRVGALPLWRDEVVCLAAARNSAIPSSISPQAFRRLRQVAFQMNLDVPQRVRTLLAANLCPRDEAGAHLARFPGARCRRRPGGLRGTRSAQGCQSARPLTRSPDRRTQLRQ